MKPLAPKYQTELLRILASAALTCAVKQNAVPVLSTIWLDRSLRQAGFQQTLHETVAIFRPTEWRQHRLEIGAV